MRFVDSCHALARPFFLQISHYAVHTNIETTPASLGKVGMTEPGRRHRPKEWLHDHGSGCEPWPAFDEGG